MTNGDIDSKVALGGLVESIKKGDCILFLGAGLHAPPPKNSSYQYPEEERPPGAWTLTQSLAKLCSYKETMGEEPNGDLQRVALCYEYTLGLGRESLIKELKKQIKSGKKPSPAVRMLASMPFKIVVTTNWDTLFETALQDPTIGKDPYVVVYDPDPTKHTTDVQEDPEPDRPLLFKIHGDLDTPDSIVITDEDYITFVQRMSDIPALHPVPETIRYRMTRWPTLFIGYSLRDYNMRLLFRTLRWRLDRSEFKQSISVDFKPDPLILKVWQDERRFIAFVNNDLWTFVPWLYKQVHGKEYQA
jgi:hypothetical protein